MHLLKIHLPLQDNGPSPKKNGRAAISEEPSLVAGQRPLAKNCRAAVSEDPRSRVAPKSRERCVLVRGMKIRCWLRLLKIHLPLQDNGHSPVMAGRPFPKNQLSLQDHGHSPKMAGRPFLKVPEAV